MGVEPGEIFCLLGQNGAGKTTTINCFLGFVEPTAGSARIAGVDVQADPAGARAAAAYIPETVLLYPQLTGVENLEFFTRLNGDRYTRPELRALLREAGLPEGADLVGTLRDRVDATWDAPRTGTFGAFWAAYPQYAYDTAATGPAYSEKFAVWHYTVGATVAPVAGAYDARMRARVDATERLSAWNLATLAAAAFERVAATGPDDYDRFQAALAAHNRVLQDLSFEATFRNRLPTLAEYAARPR